MGGKLQLVISHYFKPCFGWQGGYERKQEKPDLIKSYYEARKVPVYGTLINFMGMRKINTQGTESANKVMFLAAIAYNPEKVLKHGI